MKSVLCGTGWRASFYIRIANLLPSLLKITSIYSSSRDRADEMRKKGLNCVSSLNEALDTDHDAVIVATGKERFYPLMMELGKRGEFTAGRDPRVFAAAERGVGGYVFYQNALFLSGGW